MNSSSLPAELFNSLPPLLRLATELHLEIISHLPTYEDAKHRNDLAIIRLRSTNRYFHNLIPAPTHDDLLHLEHSSFARNRYLLACKFCIRLRHKSHFAASMLTGQTGVNGSYREKRFCADCGFDTTTLGTSQRHSPGTRANVDGIAWVWCVDCHRVKKGDAAKSTCAQLCGGCAPDHGYKRMDAYFQPIAHALTTRYAESDDDYW